MSELPFPDQRGKGIAINPGTGPITGTQAEHAERNMAIFREDLALLTAHHKLSSSKCDLKIERNPDGDADGLYSFTVSLDERICEIDMPGLPIEQVRWLRLPEQDIWDYPRLYVDGSSWVWFFAVRNAERTLFGDEDGYVPFDK